MKNTIKGLIMAVVGFLAATIADLEVVNWAYVGITTVGFTLMYLAKNFFLPSNSDEGGFNWRDALNGVLIAVSMALSNFAAVLLTVETLDWKQLGVSVLGAVAGYFIKTVPQGKKG